MRLGLRWFLKPTSRPGVTITRRREQIGNFQRWVPAPPADAEIARGELGGVPALHVATPLSRPDRHILFLHGGGYVTGIAGSLRAPAVAHRVGRRGAGRGRAVPAGARAPVPGGAR